VRESEVGVTRRLSLVALVTAFYLIASWMVRPGFYDGFAPALPYNFVCPPTAGTNSGVKPGSGHLEIKVINGVSDASSAFTDDAQLIMGFVPGAFDATGKSSVSVDIKPVSPCPNPSNLHFATNTYLVSANAPLVKGAHLVMTYSDLEPDPSYVYQAGSRDGPWTNLGSSQQAQFWTIQPASTVLTLGYFAAGYPSSAISHSSVRSQLLPAAVALLIVGVLIAGLPLAIVRKRRLVDDPEPERD
jgi:hypothetical protein